MAESEALTVCIAGLGLMGGSLALAWRAAGWPARLIGVARRAETLEAARAAGALDWGTTDLAAASAASDVVVLATPVRTIVEQLPIVGRFARPGALITDLGSSKGEICAAMAGLPAPIQAVGGHPLCGKETSGFAAADAALFRGRPWVLCPLPGTTEASLDLAARLAAAAGAYPVRAEPAAHDRAVAAISHLPYGLAVTLAATVAADGGPLAAMLAASGFRDTSRVAAGDVDMMLDVLLTNRPALLEWMDAFAGHWAALRLALDSGDEASLRARLEAGREGRAAIAQAARW